jgi:hypothetical protein
MLMNGINHSIEPKIGDLITYLFSDNACRIIATKTEPHRQRFGNEEIDKHGYERPVPDGFDFTVVDTGLEFSPYIDIRISEIR